LRGHFCPSRWAAAYWRDQSKAGNAAKRAIINTSSTSGLFGNVGQTNYGAAKTGLATFSIIANQELQRYGVRVNAIAPAAATRLTATVGADDSAKEEWTSNNPGNISPFVAYLATEDCPVNGRVFFVMGNEVFLFQPFVIVDSISRGEDGFWTVEELQQQAAKFQDYKFDYGHPLGEMLFRGPRGS
jgi:NAD(P)-dependent dehydrogenase (short-subunit alcohol dehydrogenase family)